MINKIIKGMCVSVVLGSALLSNAAMAVPFSITGATLTGGNGYGIDASEASDVATLLGASFSTSAFVAQNFALTTVNQSVSFKFGSVNFFEPNNIMGIIANETNDLGVTASFVFGSPTTGSKVINAVGTAITGSVSDNAVDFTIDWTDMNIAFGTTGLYRLSINDLSFTNVGSQDLFATVTLLRNDTGTVPEPSSLALTGLAFAALGVASRRRNKR